jgi:DNA polymerase-3 subunit epsilon
MYIYCASIINTPCGVGLVKLDIINIVTVSSEANVIIEQPLVFVDVETTGMSPQRARVIEVAAIRVEHGEIIDSLTSLIDPGTPIPYPITQITGITNSDVAGKPSFDDIADRLQQLCEGAVFVAHNVRFDYSFLRQEFEYAGLPFSPRQICTVKLSRALYPAMTRHRLSDLIEYHNFSFVNRHRAYDDALVLVQFWQKLHTDHTLETIESAIKAQFASPSIPRHLDASTIRALPSGPGVYIFEDGDGAPLYIGKSINIKKRVLSHFTNDTRESKEFKISQNVRHVSYIETSGELSALLLESSLIKQHMPVYNRQLRRVRSLTVTQQKPDAQGYLTLSMSSLSMSDIPEYSNIVAMHPRRAAAKSSLLTAVKTFDLCPKLCGLEKNKGACFSYHLGKCRGACVGKEPPESYNTRLAAAYAERGIDSWPHDGAVIIMETHDTTGSQTGYVVNNWIIEGVVTAEADYEPLYRAYDEGFDLDAYTILRSYLLRNPDRVTIKEYAGEFSDS